MRRLHLEAAAASGRPFAPPDRGGGFRARQSTVIAIHGRSLMSRILAYTSPALGHLYPLTPILDELPRRGHDISLRTIESQGKLLLGRGFNASPISPKIETVEHYDCRPRHSLEALIHVMSIFSARARAGARHLLHAIAEGG